MSARILDGKAVAAELRAETASAAAAFSHATGRPPGLGVILVGEDPASQAYVAAKKKACAAVGIHSREIRLPARSPRTDILAAVRDLNEDPAVDGILVQLPLPNPSDEPAVLEAVDPAKDVDGFHPVNMGRLALGLPTLVPCTPAGILELLRRSGIPLRGAAVTILGRSRIVGRPLSLLLSQKGVDATVTVCHSQTPDPGRFTREAEILIAAVGQPRFVTADMVRPGAVVVDVGIHRLSPAEVSIGPRLCGDVDFDAVAAKAGAITPVPGGVGPMTIAMLLSNTLRAARRQAGHLP